MKNRLLNPMLKDWKIFARLHERPCLRPYSKSSMNFANGTAI